MVDYRYTEEQKAKIEDIAKELFETLRTKGITYEESDNVISSLRSLCYSQVQTEYRKVQETIIK